MQGATVLRHQTLEPDAPVYRRTRLSTLAGGAAFGSGVGSGVRLELSQRRTQRVEGAA